MSIPQVVFLVLAALMLVSAGGVIWAKNQVYAAMSLVASFFFLAAIYALLAAHTLAVLQILVYAGAILMLFLFVIMLLSFEEAPSLPFVAQVTPMRVLVLLAVVAVGVGLVTVSVKGGTETKVKSVRAEGSETLVAFDGAPFQASPYALGALGEGRSKDAEFKVLRATGGSTPEYAVTYAHGLLAPGDEVTLWPQVENVTAEYGTVQEVGKLMYSRYLLPFEATSLLLLVAIVGAVVVAKGKI